MMKNAKSLRQARNTSDVISLRRSHYGQNNWRIMTDGIRVWISQQRIGEAPTDRIEVPKGIFDRLLALYEREQ